MLEYNENDFENTEHMYHYNMTEGNGDPSQGPGRNRKHKSSGRASRLAKKIGAITLSAVLFGGVSFGTFYGINYAAGNPAGSSSAVENTSSTEKSSLLKNTSATSNDNSSAAKGSLDVSDIAEAVMPSIVSITNKSVQEVQNYFNMFGYGGYGGQSAQPQLQETESRGSGIIVGKNDSELLIVTNYHVIENATTISAGFIDNQVYEAVVKGTDPANDLAVIAIPLDSISADTMSNIAVAAIGDSDSLRVGEQVVAIGNALGYGQSVTTGIVSAKNRSLTASSSDSNINTSADTADIPTYIQTDAAINPGNSGGALVNMKGEVIGINSAKLASTEVEGMGYAIPMSRVSDIIENLMNETTRSKVDANEQSSIGITGASVTDAINQMYGIPAGVYVSEVTSGGAAEAAGIIKGDVITKFDGKTITDIDQLKELLLYYSAGETVEVTLQSAQNGNYTEKTVSLTLGHATGSSESGSSLQTEPSFQDDMTPTYQR